MKAQELQVGDTAKVWKSRNWETIKGIAWMGGHVYYIITETKKYLLDGRQEIVKW